MIIRFATPLDGRAMDCIYHHYIYHTVATFLNAPLAGQAFEEKIGQFGEELPFLVAEEEGEIMGYAYASYWRYRHAYRFGVELSIYLKPGLEHRGIGKKLYKKLLDILSLQGYKSAYAGITLPNEASVGLHRFFGFTDVGVYKNTGYKQGRWLDVPWLEKSLGDYDDQPAEPKKVMDVIDTKKALAVI